MSTKRRSKTKYQRPVFRKSRKLLGPEKPILKHRPPYSVKLVFSYVVKGIKIKITAKFRASRSLRFEDTKSIMSPEMRLKSFGTFEKQAPYLSQTKLVLVFVLVLGSKVPHYHQRSDKVFTTNLPHSNITSPCLLVEICSHNFSEHTKHSPLGKTKNDYSTLTLHFINKEEISKYLLLIGLSYFISG